MAVLKHILASINALSLIMSNVFCTVGALKRFASHTEDEIIKKRLTNVPVNTERNNKKAASLLREYLTETEQSSNFEVLCTTMK
jgi:hypothetical protein